MNIYMLYNTLKKGSLLLYLPMLKRQRSLKLGRWFIQVKEREGTCCISARTGAQISRSRFKVSKHNCLSVM